MSNEKEAKIIKVINLLKVAKPLLIGQIAQSLWPDEFSYTTDVSLTNNIRKILDLQVELCNLNRGRGWYSAKKYAGKFEDGSHDQVVTEAIAKLILLKLPITLFREVSFPVGLRSDIVTLIGKKGKGMCAVVEITNKSETPEYSNQKIVAWRNFKEATTHLSSLFGTAIPHFLIATQGINHPETMSFESFIKEVKR